MKKTKVFALLFALALQMVSPFAYAEDATCRCSTRVDSFTTVDYAWTQGSDTAVGIVKINGKQVGTYKTNVSDVGCAKDALCK